MGTRGIIAIFRALCIAFLCLVLIKKPRLSCLSHRELKERFLSMADKSSLQPIPEGWRFETKQKKDGSQVSYYFCPKTGQRFYTHEDMMRYVNYAKEAGLPMYIPDFLSRKRKITSQSSESADNQIEKSLDSEKGTDIEQSLDSKKAIRIEKSSDSEEGTDNESFDSEKTADAGESEFPKYEPSEISVSEADIIPSEDPFIVEQAPMQAILVNPPAVENPNPVNLPSEDPVIVEQPPMQAIMVNPPAVENHNPVNQGPAVRNHRLPLLHRAFPRGGGDIRKTRPKMI